jgi:hypothetical protein
LLNLHLYGGLVTCWYLLVYGVSSLTFNHPWLIPDAKGAKRTWEKPLALPDEPDDLKLAERVRDELGLIGWTPPWEMRRDAEKELHFENTHPGRKYRLHVDRSAGLVRVEEQPQGLRPVVLALHGLSEPVPNAGYLQGWSFYTEATTVFVLFAVGSGIWLWAWRSQEKRMAFAILIGSAAASLGFMAWVHFVG